MNCTNCGAPLAPAAGGEQLECGHCSTVCFREPVSEGVDRIMPQGEAAPGQCPFCELPLELGSLDGEMMIYCPSCRGMLLTNDALARVVTRRRAEYKGADATPAPVEREKLARRVACPQCQQPMECHVYGGPGAVVIDSCFRCRLVWLDSGEISSMERAAGKRREAPRTTAAAEIPRMGSSLPSAFVNQPTVCDLAIEGLSTFLRCFGEHANRSG